MVLRCNISCLSRITYSIGKASRRAGLEGGGVRLRNGPHRVLVVNTRVYASDWRARAIAART